MIDRNCKERERYRKEQKNVDRVDGNPDAKRAALCMRSEKRCEKKAVCDKEVVGNGNEENVPQ